MQLQSWGLVTLCILIAACAELAEARGEIGGLHQTIAAADTDRDELRRRLDTARAGKVGAQLDRIADWDGDLRTVVEQRDHLAEQMKADRLHAVINAALITFWHLDRAKEPDVIALAAAGSHASILVDGLRAAGLPIEGEGDDTPTATAVAAAVRALDRTEHTPASDEGEGQ